MLPVAMLATIATLPGQSVGISVFNEPLRNSLNLSHSQLTGAYLLGTLLASLPAFVVGKLMDRFGIRVTITIVIFLLGVACLFTSQAGGLVTIFIAFLLLRVLGHSALPLLVDNTMAMWFRRRLGLVSGLRMMAMTLAVGFYPGLILWMIRVVGWRWSYAILGLLLWAIMLPLIWLLFRNRPEDVHQLPDGDSVVESSQNNIDSNGIEANDYNLNQAFRTRSFWILLMVHAFWSVNWAGITFNVVPLMQSRGFTDTIAVSTFITMAFSLTVSQLVGGILADRVGPQWLTAIATVGIAIGLAVLLSMQSLWHAHLYAASFGIGNGLALVVSATVWVRYYGRDHLGKIKGVAWSAAVAGSSVGPFLLGVSVDYFGNYDNALILLITIAVPAALVSCFALDPSRRSVRQQGDGTAG